MPPYISDSFLRSSPEYEMGYKEGFRDAKHAAEKRLKSILKEIKELEPFMTYTATTSTKED